MSECIEWQGAVATSGYGAIRRDGVTQNIHRYTYIQAYGPLGPGIVVRHKCDNKLCYNLEHLEPGTQSDNIRDYVERGDYRNQNTGKTHCPRGHEYDYFKSERRHCSECRREHVRAYRRRQKEMQ